MKRNVCIAILVALVIALVPTSALFACTVNCANGSCSSPNGTCKCVSGDPVCTDAPKETEETLQAQAKYTRSLNLPRLNRVADALEKMADALARGDQDAYFLGILEREDALKSLSHNEQHLLNSWDGGNANRREAPRQ